MDELEVGGKKYRTQKRTDRVVHVVGHLSSNPEAVSSSTNARKKRASHTRVVLSSKRLELGK
jgi:hypothetical protein